MKNRIFRFPIAALSLLILMLLCACDFSDPVVTDPIPVVTEVSVTEPQPSEPTPTTEPTSEPTQAIDDGSVYPVYEEIFRWQDGVGNLNEVQVTIPAMAGNSPIASEFTAKIDQITAPVLAEIADWMQTECSTMWSSISYREYRNREMLSVILIRETPIDLVYYDVFNFDLNDQESMDVAEMCDEYLDISYPQFLKAVMEWMTSDFQITYEDFKNIDPEGYEFILHEFTDNPFVMFSYSLFLNEDGKLMLIYDSPSLAGASFYPTITEYPSSIQYSDEQDAYNWLFDLSGKVDGAYATAYDQILKITFTDDPEDFSEALAKWTSGDTDQIIMSIVSAFTMDVDETEDLRNLCRDIENTQIRDSILNLLG